MLCAKCHNELAICASFTTAETDGSGATHIYSVVDLKCTDENCPNGRLGTPTARLKRLISNANTDETALSCCGIPLLYQTADSYWIPDASLVKSESGSEAVLRCPSCGAEVSADVSGKTKI